MRLAGRIFRPMRAIGKDEGGAMLNADRRSFLALAGGAGLALAAGGIVAAQPAGLTRMTGGVVPISPAERLSRIAKAQRLMKDSGVSALIIEPGASLTYFTGVRWWRSERVTAAVIPVTGEALIVTPHFEEPSVRATNCRGCRTAPATASAWTVTSRSISSMARRPGSRPACACRTNQGSTCPGSSACVLRTVCT